MVRNQEKYIVNLRMNNLSNQKYIKVIQTRKYKDINLYLRFSIENKPLLKEKVALLCKLIGDISNKYPSKLEMTKARDMLYGINLNASYKVRANIISLSLHYSFINPKFVDATIEEYNNFIKETLYNSIIDKKTLDEAKRTVKAATLRKIDKPTAKANQRFVEIVSKDNPEFEIYSENEKFIKNIDKIKLDDIVKVYRTIINKSQLNVYLCGDLDNNEVFKLTTFNFNGRDEAKLKVKKIKHHEKKMIIDKKDISQSYLSVVYATPFNKNSKEYFAWFLGNAFLGVVPTSLLFSEVREKMSLCYAISSVDFKNEGLVRIVTSIDAKNKDKTIKAIETQIKRLISKDYDETQLEITKTLMCNSIISIYDDLDALIDYYYESMLSNFNYSIEEYCENISKVTSKDIANVYKKYNHYFNYILLGTKHE